MKNKIIGNRITEARRRAGLSTSTLAKKVGKSQATISRIENGKQSINLQLLVAISRALGVHPFNLLGKFFSKRKEPSGSGCLAEVLRSARIFNNISVQKIAKTLKQSKRYIKELEEGLILPNMVDIPHFAKFYNLNLNLLEELVNFEQYAPELSKHFSEITTLLSAQFESTAETLETLHPEPAAAQPYAHTQIILDAPDNTANSGTRINHILLKIINNETDE